MQTYLHCSCCVRPEGNQIFKFGRIKAIFHPFIYRWNEFNLREMLRYAAEILLLCYLIMMFKMLWRVSGGRRQKFQMQSVLVLITADDCSSSNSRGNSTWVKGGSAWKCVCMCECNLPEFPSCSWSCTNSPWISPIITLQYLYAQKTVCAFDCRLILQCSCSLAKGVGLTCYLGQSFSVFSISETSKNLMRVFFFFPLQNEKHTSGNTCHLLLKYKMNKNTEAFKQAVGWKKGSIFPALYFRGIEWWAISDEPK